MKHSILAFLVLVLALALFACVPHLAPATTPGTTPAVAVTPKPAPYPPMPLGAALVPQRAGDFFVSPAASSPFKLGQHVTFTDGTTPAISGDSSATSLTMGTNKAGATTTLTSGLNLAAVKFDTAGTTWGTGDTFYESDGTTILAMLGQTSFGIDGIWLKPGAATFNNVTLGYEGSNVFLNAPLSKGLELLQNNATTLGYFPPSGTTLYIGGATAGTAPVYFDWTTGTAPSIQAGTGATSGLLVGGALRYTTRTVTASFTVDTTTTDNVIIVDTSGGAVTVTLPAPTNGRHLYLIDKANHFGTSNCTLAQHAIEKIDGTAASKTLASSGERCLIDSDGTDWYTRCNWLLPLFFLSRRRKRSLLANDNAERTRDWLDEAA